MYSSHPNLDSLLFLVHPSNLSNLLLKLLHLGYLISLGLVHLELHPKRLLQLLQLLFNPLHPFLEYQRL